MRIIHAEWEKRNLGVDCTELEFDRSDPMEDVLAAISAADTEYQVAKVPVGCPDIQFALQDAGFRFIETNIQVSKVFPPNMPNIDKKYAKLAQLVEVHDASPEETERILAEIEKGDIFTTDKVACDPCFSKELAGRRYSLWTRDLIARGAMVMVSTFRGEPMGFAIYVDKGSYWDGFLGGLFSEQVGTGMGPLHWYACREYENAGKMPELKTGTSTNNPICRTYLNSGFSIDRLTNIFIKHK